MNAQKPLLAALIAAAFSASALSQSNARPSMEPINVKIIGLNDYHGTLQSPGTFGVNTTVPAARRPAVGGAEFVAAHVALMKAANRNNVVVGAGDFIGASPLVSALFFDEPAVETLNLIGLDFISVGNHEFDKGKDELLRLQKGGCKITDGLPDPNSCKGFGSATPGSFDGARYQWLAANVVETTTGRTLLPAYGVKRFKGVPVAFIGMTLQATPSIVTPTGVAGLEFRNEADTVNQLVPRLRARGIEAIVVLVHQGGFQTGAGNASDINGCLGNLKNADGSDSDIRKLVAGLDDAVDLVISGHTHAAYNCSAGTVDVVSVGGQPVSTARMAGLPNQTGRLVPVTSTPAFGRVLTEVDVSIDPVSRDVVTVSAKNKLVDRTDPAAIDWVAANPQVANVVASYATAVSPLAAAVIGTITAGMPNTAGPSGEQPAGALIADAQLQATQPAGAGGAVMAFMNPGGVRSPGIVNPAAVPVYPYNFTYGNAFTVQPFGNSLVTMTLTAQQIKNLLEQQFVGCLGQGTQRILQISNGLRYTWKASGAPCARVSNVTFTATDLSVNPPAVQAAPEVIVDANGALSNPAKTYRVTVNNFLATGGDGFTVLTGGTSALGGAQDIDALVAYLAGFKAPLPPYDPGAAVLSKPRIVRVD